MDNPPVQKISSSKSPSSCGCVKKVPKKILGLFNLVLKNGENALDEDAQMDILIQSTTFDPLYDFTTIQKSLFQKCKTILKSSTSKLGEFTKVYENLYIGNLRGALNFKWMETTQITHIINCTSEPPQNGIYGPTRKVFHLPSIDNNMFPICQHFPTIHTIFTKAFEDPKSKIFIHCNAGVSRSATLAIYGVMTANKQELSTVLSDFRKVRMIHPADGFLAQLIRHRS